MPTARNRSNGIDSTISAERETSVLTQPPR